MNIFKKELDDSLFERSKQRVLSLFKDHIPKYKQTLFKKTGLFFIGFGGASLIFKWCLAHNQLGFPLFIIALSSAVLVPIFLFNVLCNFIDLISLHIRAVKLTDSLDITYDRLASNSSFNEKLDYLTSQEINELFSSSLHPTQLQYLHSQLFNKEYLTLYDLKEVTDLALEDKQKETMEKLAIEEKTKMAKLDDFFDKHHIEPNSNYHLLSKNVHSKLTLYQEINTTAKEKTLSSLL